MRVWASTHKNNKVILRTHADSLQEDISLALMECLEPIYKELDISEPIWLKKHALELSRFRRTKFLPEDFIDPVNFDYFEIEFSSEA